MGWIREWLAGGLSVLLSVLSGAGGRPGSARKLQPITPPDLEFASEIMDVLAESGLDVFAVHVVKLPPMPGTGHEVLLLTNEKKFIYVYFFPGENDADHISITYSRSSEPGKHHHYAIEGSPVPGGEVRDTFQPLYFTLRGRWLIQTGDPELDAQVKKALGEMGPAAEPQRLPCPSLPLALDLRLRAHRRAARPVAGSTARLVPRSLSLPHRKAPPSHSLGRLLAVRADGSDRRVGENPTRA